MKVKCIKNNGLGNHLTIGKTYDVIRIGKWDNYIIIDDKGKEDWFYKEDFKLLSEIRNNKINKLLGE